VNGVPAGSHDAIMERAEQIMALGETARRRGRDPVNQPMINNWVEAIGDRIPFYVDPDAAAGSVHGGIVAPPAMAQVWTMGGLHPQRDPGEPLYAAMSLLDDAGFTSVLATNCEQSYGRYLRLGEELSVTTRLDSVIGPKRTAVGEGYFVTTTNTWYVGEERVASMLFRVLKFKPGAAPAAASPADALRPQVNRDTEFIWAGARKGELRVQTCSVCGRLRHPPGPVCPRCGAAAPSYTVVSGRGSVFSYVVHHHPPLPGKELPLVLALVELDEGVRMVGELLDTAPDEVEIGQAVEVAWQPVDDDLTLPAWRPSPRVVEPDSRVVELVETTHPSVDLPPWELPVTATLIVSGAIATRDFQDVHHDRDLAVERGSQDIFLNILTTTGLVQRFVTDWAGPAALVREIKIRLGAPAYPGDPLSFTGAAQEQVEVDGERRQVVAIRGANSRGDHVTGTVTIAVP